MPSQQKFDRGDIRRLNAVSVLNQLRLKGALSRANIAFELGLTRATVSNIIANLIDASMVSETEYDSGRAGRPGLLLNLNPAFGAMIAVDIDIDSISILLTDFGQEVLYRAQNPIDSEGSSEATLAIAVSMVEKAIQLSESKGLQCLGICVTWAGLVDREEGQLAFGPTTGWQRVALKTTWEKRFEVSVYVENEAHAGAIGVHHFGERPGVRNLIYLSLGGGLAAGVFVDGVLLRGKLGFAGQVGHTSFADNGVVCSCGKQGCWVTEIGAAALFRKLSEAGVDFPTNNASGNGWIDCVLNKVELGDEVVLGVLSEIGASVGAGLARLVQTFNPSMVVVGGRLSELLKYVEPVIREATLNDTLAYMTDPLELIVGTSGDDALRGGIATVFDSVMKNPKIGEMAGN